jgi:predicted NBD/HSP70 family sugar kinase
MSSFLRQLLLNKQVRTQLDFGINENVRLVKIDNTQRKREGEVVNRNTYMTFSKFDSKGEVMASSEFSFFNLDPTADKVMENFANQVAVMQNIVNVLNPGVVIDPTTGYDDFEEIEKDLKNKKGCKTLMDTLWSLFEEALKDKVGEDSILVRLKVVTNNKGKYLQLPNEGSVMESMEVEETKLAITAYERNCKDKGLEAPVESADTKGSAPAEKPKKAALTNL